MGVTDFFCGFLSNAKGHNFRNRDTRSRAARSLVTRRAGRTFGTVARAVTIDAHCRRWIAHRLAEGEKGSESLVALDLLGNAIELGESLRLMEVLFGCGRYSFEFQDIGSPHDERAEEMADQLLASARRAAEQAEVPRRSRDIR